MRLRTLLLLLPVLLAGIVIQTTKKESDYPKVISDTSQAKPAHPTKFYDETLFFQGVAKAQNSSKPEYRIVGGVVPHDLFPSFIIADFFQKLSFQWPKTVILIGPNHYERGGFKALSSRNRWETPFGIVEPKEQIIEKLLVNNLVKIGDEVLQNDHSVAGIMPFVKYYLPDTRVVPILLSGYMNQEESMLLAQNLKRYLDKDTILIAAVDFSHYLANQEAQEKDKVTWEIMKNFDYRHMFLLNNDYLDSPPSIALLLMTMQMVGTTNMDLFHHTNSGELQKNSYIDTTSYFSIAFH